MAQSVADQGVDSGVEQGRREGVAGGGGTSRGGYYVGRNGVQIGRGQFLHEEILGRGRFHHEPEPGRWRRHDVRHVLHDRGEEIGLGEDVAVQGGSRLGLGEERRDELELR